MFKNILIAASAAIFVSMSSIQVQADECDVDNLKIGLFAMPLIPSVRNTYPNMSVEESAEFLAISWITQSSLEWADVDDLIYMKENKDKLIEMLMHSAEIGCM